MFTLITGNAHKAREVALILGRDVPHQKIDLPEIQSLDLAEIAAFKAREAFKILGTPVLVEDVGLVFHALGRLPGPFIKWFVEDLKAKGLCDLLKAHSDRSATAHIVYALYDGTELKTFAASASGKILEEPRGKQDFGWDCIFVPDGFETTYAEMRDDEKSKISHRAKGLALLQSYLKAK